MTDAALVQYGTEAFEDCRVDFWRVFLEESSDLARETEGNFERVVRRSLKKEDENLEPNQLVGNALVDGMCDECRR